MGVPGLGREREDIAGGRGRARLQVGNQRLGLADVKAVPQDAVGGVLLLPFMRPEYILIMSISFF